MANLNKENNRNGYNVSKNHHSSNTQLVNYNTQAVKSRSGLVGAAFQDKILREYGLKPAFSCKNKIKSKKKNIYQKIHQENRKLTLAQKLGFENKPPSPTKPHEWAKIEAQSMKRNDCKYGCSICQDDFKLKPQVILTCSHTFHHACLTAFEKHAQMLCCPLCRAKNYERKFINDGAECV